MDDEDDAPSTHGDWLAHPYTRSAAKALVARQGNLLLELFTACEHSSDPRVSAALARYQSNAQHLNLYQPRKVST